MNWDWLPGERYGPFVFGQPLPEPCAELEYKDLGWGDDGTGWDSYSVQEGALTLHVAGGELVAVECWQSLSHAGQNLVGLTSDVARALFEQAIAPGAAVGEAQSLEVAELGLSLWIEDGRVESASIQSV